MPKLELTPKEAFVLIDFLIRFRDKEVITFEHEAEKLILWDLCAMLENQVPELLDPNYKELLHKARELLSDPDYE